MNKLEFLGIGSAFNTFLGNTSAFYKEDGHLLLIDCGESVFSRIRELDLLDGINKVDIIITHFHPDHVGSLGSLMFYTNIKAHIPTSLICASEEQKQDFLNLLPLMGVSNDIYTFMCPEDITKDFKFIQVIKTRKVNHSKNINSWAFELGFGTEKIHYSGDTCDREYAAQVVESLRPQDTFYCEVSTHDYPGSVHLSLEFLKQITPVEKRAQVTCMHFESDELIRLTKDAGFNIAALAQK